ncbi:uncharacterized protein BT62DRAFT_937006 [Guyanagaster necrorhizus]|uniref:Uncharacterized protein n=1 Tax=Guyanagaster necrorhizus TaxID=856835 RepID=A0A9P7VIU8_9AGAR|nr:uncharacterized protein BT62DRAFT_937006 [Guyanagaster necrorhizus MCA 3950]KAG7441489.1 hypothetical protein BT62DRAFT_937006 [Guyanagaster necrorhizus MCA 3950]
MVHEKRFSREGSGEADTSAIQSEDDIASSTQLNWKNGVLRQSILLQSSNVQV